MNFWIWRVNFCTRLFNFCIRLFNFCIRLFRITLWRYLFVNNLRILYITPYFQLTSKGVGWKIKDQEVSLVENPELREENEGAPNCDTEKAQNELLDENNNSHQIYEKSKSLFEIIREKSDHKIPSETLESDLFDSLKGITIDSEKKMENCFWRFYFGSFI